MVVDSEADLKGATNGLRRGLCGRWAAPVIALGAIAPATHATDEVSPVVVTAPTPLAGARIDVAKAPFAVATLGEADLAGDDGARTAGALAARLGGVNIDDNLDDAFQPDILFRGFEASPVLGTPQGLAVYQNGVRINEAFGDTVNWDLVPDTAVARVQVTGSNPVYGLNALGGAVVVELKAGFDNPGGAIGVSGGAFGRRALEASYGGHRGGWGGFIAVRGLDQDGWRLESADRVRQLYATVGWRGGPLTLDLSYTGASNALHGESAAPVQELALGRALIFTWPQVNKNQVNFVALNGSYAAGHGVSLRAVAYARDFRQRVLNGNTTNYTACAASDQLCQSDAATPLLNTAGDAIPDLTRGGTVAIGENDREATHALTFGGTLQLAAASRIGGMTNQMTLGASLDGARVSYGASAEVGVINAALAVLPSGEVVATPEGTGFTATPVAARANNAALGLFFTDTLDLTPRLSLTASARYNRVRIAIADQRGAALTGTNIYARFNPAIGVTYALSRSVSLYAGYAESSRAPTAGEIECSDPAAPCLLPSSLSADPPRLKQVVSHTWEAGLRGGATLGRGRVTYSLGLYRTAVSDDIYAVATGLAAGYFQNIGGTRRQGGEITLRYTDRRFTAWVDYAVVQASFRSTFVEPSPAHPLQDVNGDITVQPGDRLPGIPARRLKLGLEARVWRGLTLGADLQAISGRYYRGDESNQLTPLPGYAVAGLHADWALGERVSVFARIENVLNARYATFGLLGDPTGIGAPGVPDVGADPRFQSPAPPLAAYGGVKLRF